LAEVDLQLVARRGFHPNRCQRGHALRAPQVDHRPLNRPDTQRAATLGEEPLHHDRVALGRSLVERPGLTAAFVGQPPCRRPDLLARRDGLTQIPPHRIHRDANLAGDRLLADAATRERANRGHQLPFDHRYLLRRSYQHVPLELHSTLLPGGQN
jgi:hypothetical protein